MGQSLRLVLGLEQRRDVGESLACSHSVRDSETLVGCTVRSPRGWRSVWNLFSIQTPGVLSDCPLCPLCHYLSVIPVVLPSESSSFLLLPPRPPCSALPSIPHHCVCVCVCACTHASSCVVVKKHPWRSLALSLVYCDIVCHWPRTQPMWLPG